MLPRFIRATLVFRYANQSRPRPPIVPRELVAVVEDPEKSQTQAEQGDQREAEALEGDVPGDRPAVGAHHFDVPGAHAQGLAAAYPEAAEVQETDREQVYLVEGVDDESLFAAAGQPHVREARHHKDGEQQQGVVDHGAEAAEETGGRGLRVQGVVLHGGVVRRASGCCTAAT